MAANYWDSTQRRFWQFSKDDLAHRRKALENEDPHLAQAYALPQLRHMSIFFNQQLNRLGKRLQVRQQAMATAQLYIRRFYLKVEVRRTNPYLVMATALYLACKMEECPQHIRLVVSEARSFWPEFFSADTSKLGECEFFLISEMNSQLIVHQPYRTVTSLHGTFALSPEEQSMAWSIVNDHYMTDLPLLYAPHIIALTAIFLAIMLRPVGSGAAGSASSPIVPSTPTVPGMGLAQQNPSITASMASAAQAALTAAANPRATPAADKDGRGTAGSPGGASNPAARFHKLTAWLAESNIEVEALVDCTQELISFYNCHEQYNEKLTREQINRYVKARGLDK